MFLLSRCNKVKKKTIKLNDLYNLFNLSFANKIFSCKLRLKKTFFVQIKLDI